MIPQGPDEAAKSAEEEWRNDTLVEKAVLSIEKGHFWKMVFNIKV